VILLSMLSALSASVGRTRAGQGWVVGCVRDEEEEETYQSILLVPALSFPNHGKYRSVREYLIQFLGSRLLVLLSMSLGTPILEATPYL
jgi:hypothetical protein